ncbi:hypothetical protein CCP3SC15_480017 [Gammaproteobacteria bacterium]
MWVCEQELWRTSHGKIVEASDPRCTNGAVLIATVGMVFQEKPTIEKNPNKKVLPQSEDKAVKPSSNKGGHTVPLLEPEGPDEEK